MYFYRSYILNTLNIINDNLESFWNDENLFIYKVKKSLPYYYLPKKISTTNNKFYEYSIDKNEVYLSKDNFEKYKNLKLGPAEYSFKILNNSYFEVNYKSMSENFDSLSFKAAKELIFDGIEQPSGYTEPILHKKRLEYKKINN